MLPDSRKPSARDRLPQKVLPRDRGRGRNSMEVVVVRIGDREEDGVMGFQRLRDPAPEMGGVAFASYTLALSSLPCGASDSLLRVFPSGVRPNLSSLGSVLSGFCPHLAWFFLVLRVMAFAISKTTGGSGWMYVPITPLPTRGTLWMMDGIAGRSGAILAGKQAKEEKRIGWRLADFASNTKAGRRRGTGNEK